MDTCINVPGFKTDAPWHPLLEKLDHCHGSERCYQHPMFKFLVYTEGMKMLFEEGKCYWLLDLLGSILGKPKVAIEEKRFVHVTRKGTKGSVVVYAPDGEKDKVIYSQDIPYTDFPFESFHFRWEHTVLEYQGQERIHHLAFLYSED